MFQKTLNKSRRKHRHSSWWRLRYPPLQLVFLIGFLFLLVEIGFLMTMRWSDLDEHSHGMSAHWKTLNPRVASSSKPMGANKNLSRAEISFSKLQLFASAFPGDYFKTKGSTFVGFGEMRSTLIRSLEFFWPLEYLNLTIVLDDTVYNNDDVERDRMTALVQSFFRADLRNRVSVRYNPQSNMTIWKRGWNIQQLIMFWADNFTDAEYIGFVDDDTLFTKAILPYDLFDSQGRPRVLAQYRTGPSHNSLLETWFQNTHYTLGRPAYVNAMTYFPVILHRSHLAKIRQGILQVHASTDSSAVVTFDDFLRAFMGRGSFHFSQFCIMFDYLWEHHRTDYSWRFEADAPDGPYFPQGLTASDAAEYNPSIASGSPQDHGITSDMLQPFPHVAVHAGYILGGRKKGYPQRDNVVSNLMRRGYCYSSYLFLNKDYGGNSLLRKDYRPLPMDPFWKRRCGLYNVSTSINLPNDWIFTWEMAPWYTYNPEGVHKAHQERMRHNLPHDWDVMELERIFSANIHNCSNTGKKRVNPLD